MDYWRSLNGGLCLIFTLTAFSNIFNHVDYWRVWSLVMLAGICLTEALYDRSK